MRVVSRAIVLLHIFNMSILIKLRDVNSLCQVIVIQSHDTCDLFEREFKEIFGIDYLQSVATADALLAYLVPPGFTPSISFQNVIH